MKKQTNETRFAKWSMSSWSVPIPCKSQAHEIWPASNDFLTSTKTEMKSLSPQHGPRLHFYVNLQMTENNFSTDSTDACQENDFYRTPR